jgi:flagellar protein FliL
MGKLLPIVLGLAGLAGGAGAGFVLRPGPDAPEGPAETGAPAAEDGHGAANGGDHGEAADHGGEAGGHGGEKTEGKADGHGDGHGDGAAPPDYVRLNNQFIVPVVEDGRVSATVVLSLSLEVPAGGTEAVYAREPRLRDAFLRVLFDHANAGGFRGVFTDGANLVILRQALKEAARKVMGDEVMDVLISDLVRQDA